MLLSLGPVISQEGRPSSVQVWGLSWEEEEWIPRAQGGPLKRGLNDALFGTL